MVAFIASIPKLIIAIVVLMVGFAAMVYYDPPKTVCDSQMELFRQSQRDFLYYRVGENDQRFAPAFNELYSLCKTSNSPGGCFELFLRLKKMNQDLDNVPLTCGETVAQEGTIQAVMFGSMKLMAQVAWGARGPASSMRRQGWLDVSDLSVFCELKAHGERLFGREAFEGWQAGQITKLPEADKQGDQAFDKSLFATQCAQYRSM